MKEDLIDLAKFGGAVGSAAGAVLEDGKLTFSDLGVLVGSAPGLISKGMAAWESRENIKLSDLKDPQVRAEVVQAFCEEFNISADEAEEKIEALLQTAADLISNVSKLISIARSFRE